MVSKVTAPWDSWVPPKRARCTRQDDNDWDLSVTFAYERCQQHVLQKNGRGKGKDFFALGPGSFGKPLVVEVQANGTFKQRRPRESLYRAWSWELRQTPGGGGPDQWHVQARVAGRDLRSSRRSLRRSSKTWRRRAHVKDLKRRLRVGCPRGRCTGNKVQQRRRARGPEYPEHH